MDHQAPVEVREKVAVRKGDIKDCLLRIKAISGLKEVVLLSTCNRTEFYAVMEDSVRPGAMEFFKLSGGDYEEISRYIYVHEGEKAVRHLFRVACGLESMVVGEDQILGQVKEAWEWSKESQSSGKVLNRLFLDAVTLGKKARSEVKISDVPLSVSYIAVRFIEEYFGSLEGKKVFVLGTGKTGRITIKNLIQKGVGEVFVTSRTWERALALKEEIPEVYLVPYEEKYRAMASCQIVISASGAPHYTVDCEKFAQIYTGGGVAFLDLSVPRDIDPEIARLPNVQIFTLDDLKKTAEENQKKRLYLAKKIEEMVDSAVKDYLNWLKTLQVVPVIRKVSDFARAVCVEEFENLIRRLQNVDDKEKKQIKRAMERVCSKMTAVYLETVKYLAERQKFDPGLEFLFTGGDVDG